LERKKLRITSEFWMEQVRLHGGEFSLHMATIIAG
jgi:hypothetical protein